MNIDNTVSTIERNGLLSQGLRQTLARRCEEVRAIQICCRDTFWVLVGDKWETWKEDGAGWKRVSPHSSSPFMFYCLRQDLKKQEKL